MFKFFKWCWHRWEYYSLPDDTCKGRCRKCDKCGLEQIYHEYTISYDNYPLPEGVVKD